MLPTINIQIMCDADKNIVYISPCYTGRTHDSTALSSSAVFEHLECDNTPLLREHCYVVADLGYACSGKVIRPYSKGGIKDPSYVLFNNWHRSVRSIVENTFKDVKFRCYSFKAGCRARDFKELSDQIQAGFVLHMFAKRHEDELYKRKRIVVPFNVDSSLHNTNGAELRDKIRILLKKQHDEKNMQN